jgi:DNA repair exonuclease SbcCD ATPase subunit/DNA repair exonuclease SbcCD nuclease subunit
MPKVLITGDWQLESHPPCDRRDKQGRSIRFEENVETLLAMVDDAAARGCTRMAFLGDLTEELNPDSLSLKAAAKVFRRAEEKGMEVDADAGNHDGSIYEISSSSLEPLGLMAGSKFRVHHKVTSVKVGNCHFVFLPYLHGATPEQIRAELVKVTDPLEGDLYLFGHYGAKQSKMGAKNMTLPGDYLDADSMLAKQFKHIWMGHIHKAQEFLIDGVPFRHPGSPYICDQGEREDRKGYSIFDTETGVEEWIELKPKRRWLSIDLAELDNAMNEHAQGGEPMSTFPLPWTEDDIVRFVGTFKTERNPREEVRQHFKNGDWAVRPFFVTDEFKRVRDGRDVRAGVEAVSGAGGFAEAVMAFVAQKWPEHPRGVEIVKAVIDELKESRLASLERFVVPTGVVATKFMSHDRLEFNFDPGQATLIIGPNGLGKTNILEAILVAATGETSKGVKNAALVKQGAKKSSVTLFLKGEKNLFFIHRTFTLTKTGASHKVEAGTTPIEGATPDWYLKKKSEDNPNGYVSLADGGVADTQAAISAIIGATYKSLKATNFMFQKDKNPFIESDPGDRKAILGEILGFEPMAKAFKALDGKRINAGQVLKERRATLDGLKSALDPAQEQATIDLLAKTEAELPALTDAVAAKEKRVAETKLLADLATKQLETANTELQAMPNSSGLLTGAEDELRVLEETFTESRATMVKTYTADKAQIAAIKAELLALDVKALTAKAEEHKAAKASAQAELDAVAPELTRLATVKATANANLDTLDKERGDHNTLLISLQGNNIDKCSKCGAPVDSAHIKKEIDETEAKIKANGEARVPHNVAIQTADKELVKLNQRKTAADAALKVAGDALELVVAQVAGAKSKGEELGRLETRFKETEAQGLKAKEEHGVKKTAAEKKVADLKAVVEKETKDRAGKDAAKVAASANATTTSANASTAATELSEAKVRLVAAQTSLDSLRQALDALKDTKAKLAEKEVAVAEAEADSELRTMAAEVLAPKSGLPVWLIDARIPELEDAINRYMEEFGAEGMTIRLSTVKENGEETMDVLIDNGEEPMLDVTSYSGGQTGRIEVCIKMALADLSESMRDVRLGLLAYDEPGVNLDEERKAKLIQLINDRCTSGRTPVTLVISHDRKLMSGFHRRLAITKTEEATELVAA